MIVERITKVVVVILSPTTRTIINFMSGSATLLLIEAMEVEMPLLRETTAMHPAIGKLMNITLTLLVYPLFSESYQEGLVGNVLIQPLGYWMAMF
jgi:hypothetical protein